MKRRNLLLGAGAFALAGAVAWERSGQVDFSNLASRAKLNMPPLLDATQSASFDLTAMAGKTDFLGTGTASTAGYNQSYLGPVLRLPLRSVKASVSNHLQQDISAHWHGLLLPGEMDGGPHQSIKPGGAWRPELNISQQSTTAWYHTHVHGQTATGVYAGLAGGIILTDGRDDQRGLPSAYGEDDLFLILQDKHFSSDGQLIYSQNMMTQMHGFTADTMVVNGQVNALAEVPRGIVRLRLLNASNARIYRLQFNDARPMHLIATDGGYLDSPNELDELRLSPGERAEVLVDFSNGVPAALTSLRDPNAGMGGMMGRFQDLGANLLGGKFEVLVFAVGDNRARISEIPDTLDGSSPSLNEKTSSHTRHISLDMGGGMMGGAMAINGRSFDPSIVDFQVALRTTEKWIVSSRMLAHPFHVHGAVFQVVSENGNAPRTENRGWKDTVLVENETVLLVKFDHPTNNQSPFMYHCHILEHEDAGMMGQFSVI